MTKKIENRRNRDHNTVNFLTIKVSLVLLCLCLASSPLAYSKQNTIEKTCHTVTHCNALQHTATAYSKQNAIEKNCHTVTHCNTLQQRIRSRMQSRRTVTARSREDETPNGNRNAKRNPNRNQETFVPGFLSNVQILK